MSSPVTNNTVVEVDFSAMRKRAGATARARWSPQPARTTIKEPKWHDSEKLFLQVFNTSHQPMSITTLAEGRYVEANPTFLSLLGYTREQVVGRTSLGLGIWKNRAQRTEMVTRLQNEEPVRDFETAIRGANNQTLIWMSSADLIDVDGVPCILVISDDITKQRRAEERLRNVSARLIRAQEEERNRIARELHDSLNQKLALLCVDLEEFGRTHQDLDVSQELHALCLRLQDASDDVHGMSQQLHPPKLDYLGLIPALRDLCRELSGRRGMRISLVSDEDESNLIRLDKELELCVYRVVQEALSNVMKHSRALVARVYIKRRKDTLYVLISDAGKGFKVEAARLKGRLGLISMEERLRLANGRLIIRSRPHRGTQIEARIPLSK
ncbi:MAG TPA: PAS domain-containing sensor histidine kinase [Pyrinomonadaceae bacterium]|nr:PAS domain-containing sensor histidine kinase [Pyrinomonadaceae bacterium]